MTFKIVVTQPVHESVLARLRPYGELTVNNGPEPFTDDELKEHCRDADALMVFMTERVDRELLSCAEKLKIVAGALKGYNNINIDACTDHNIPVTIVPDLLTAPTAELTVGLMIAVARNLWPGDAHVRSGQFKGWRPQFYGGSLVGARVAVIGAGAVGQAIMHMLSGFGCTLQYVDKRPLSDEIKAQLNCTESDLWPAVEAADFVVLGIHLTDTTCHMVDDTFLGRMKPGSYLINPARGSLVDEVAIARAIESGHLAGYAADTFEMEDWARADRPNAIASGLLSSPKTILTPHIGSAVTRVREDIEHSAASAIIEVAQGRTPKDAVNRAHLD